MKKLLAFLLLLPCMLWGAQPPYERNIFSTNTQPDSIAAAAAALAGTNKWTSTNIFSDAALTGMDARFGGGGVSLSGTNTWTGPNTFSGSTNAIYNWQLWGSGSFLGGTGMYISQFRSDNLYATNLSGPIIPQIMGIAAVQAQNAIANGFEMVSTNFTGGGSNLVGLNASALASGSVPDARLSTNALMWTNANPGGYLSLTGGGNSNRFSMIAFPQTNWGIQASVDAAVPTKMSGVSDIVSLGRRNIGESVITNSRTPILLGEGIGYQSEWHNTWELIGIGSSELLPSGDVIVPIMELAAGRVIVQSAVAWTGIARWITRTTEQAGLALWTTLLQDFAEQLGLDGINLMGRETAKTRRAGHQFFWITRRHRIDNFAQQQRGHVL